MTYKVSEVAKLSGISVRTLHHYDEIGLFHPGNQSEAGYRLYTEEDLIKLQQILFFRELGFTLKEIKDLIERPDFDRKHALKAQRELLIEKMKRIEKIISAVDKSMAEIEGGVDMEVFEAFNMDEIEKHKEKYAKEVEERYGSTEAYKESAKRTAGYSKEDWERIMKNSDELYRKIVANMDKGIADEEVQKAVAGLRQNITDNFYNCTLEIFRGLGELYVQDVRFTKNIDKYKEGLAAFLREAMHYYCDIEEGK